MQSQYSLCVRPHVRTSPAKYRGRKARHAHYVDHRPSWWRSSCGLSRVKGDGTGRSREHNGQRFHSAVQGTTLAGQVCKWRPRCFRASRSGQPKAALMQASLTSGHSRRCSAALQAWKRAPHRCGHQSIGHDTPAAGRTEHFSTCAPVSLTFNRHAEKRTCKNNTLLKSGVHTFGQNEEPAAKTM